MVLQNTTLSIVPLFDYFIFLPLLIVPNVTFSNDSRFRLIQSVSQWFSRGLADFLIKHTHRYLKQLTGYMTAKWKYIMDASAGNSEYGFVLSDSTSSYTKNSLSFILKKVKRAFVLVYLSYA